MNIHLAAPWQLSGHTGWGVCGVQLAHAFGRLGHTVTLGMPPAGAHLAPWDVALLRPLLTRPVGQPDLTLAALGNGLEPAPPPGSVGLCFLEDTEISQEARGRANACRTVVCGSTWAANVLRGAGRDCGVFLQGVDHALFTPGPQPPLFPGKYVVFSGGKLEYRKGQDIVIAAFREFLKDRPDALLLTAWANAWPHTIAGLDVAGHVCGHPTSTDPAHLSKWLAANGIPPTAHYEIGPVPHHTLPYYLRAADVAVFPNRCEGGTNLVATEAMACGVPTWLSHGTGHLDLPGWFVQGHGPCRPAAGFHGVEGWVEGDPGEWATAMNQPPASTPSLSAWTWDRAAQQILAAAGAGPP